MTRELWTFPGGIHPKTHKRATTRGALQKPIIPKELIIPLQQHIGEKAKPIVAVGDYVEKGQIIAKGAHYLSVPVHASTSGTVTAIEERPIAHVSGLNDLCIIIQTDGLEHWRDKKPIEDYRNESLAVLRQRIQDAGIAGLGGAGFPTKVKLNPGEKNPIKTLIINGAECEPYISADDMLMQSLPKDIVKGIEIIQHIVGPEETLLGIEDNKPRAIQAMKEACEGKDIEVVAVPTIYPTGGEKQLIQVLTGMQVPSKKIPAQLGVLCLNVGTAAAIYRAICFDEPLLSRVITLAGDALPNPCNELVLLGTPIKSLLDHFECQYDKLDRLVMGGPLMGYTIPTADIPVIKTTNCVIAAAEGEFAKPQDEKPCIRCGACAEACPASLLPQQLYWFAKSQQLEKAEQHYLFDCIECGACAYVCPSDIPLVNYYRYAKNEVRQRQADKVKSDRARLRFEARNDRIEAEKRQREEKRKRMAKERQAAKKTTDTATKRSAVEEAVERAKAKKAAASNDNQTPGEPL